MPNYLHMTDPNSPQPRKTALDPFALCVEFLLVVALASQVVLAALLQ